MRITRYIALIACITAAFVGWYAYVTYGSHIVPYQAQRDRQAVLSIFEENWYWLTLLPPEEYSAAYRIDYKAPSPFPRDRQRLSIDVYRADEQTVGFIAYYVSRFYKGSILFLAVRQQYRKRGIARKLVEHAIKRLASRGVQVIELFTHINNEAAQRLYESIGFQRVWADDTFVTYQYQIS